MKAKYKNRLDKIVFTNRWKMCGAIKYWGNYTILGIRRFGFSSTEYEWSICFFGLELRFWMKREYLNAYEK
jgi:hypothetical protein